jgi:hypothetical protein
VDEPELVEAALPKRPAEGGLPLAEVTEAVGARGASLGSARKVIEVGEGVAERAGLRGLVAERRREALAEGREGVGCWICR